MLKKPNKVAKNKTASFAVKKFGRYKVSHKDDRTYAGIVFDSKWEMEVFKLLKQFAPNNYFVHRQVAFVLQPKFKSADGKAVREISYIADFVLCESEQPPTEIPLPTSCIVIDAKGHITDIFKIKNKMFMYCYKKCIHKVKRAADVMQALDSCI